MGGGRFSHAYAAGVGAKQSVAVGLHKIGLDQPRHSVGYRSIFPSSEIARKAGTFGSSEAGAGCCLQSAHLCLSQCKHGSDHRHRPARHIARTIATVQTSAPSGTKTKPVQSGSSR